MKEIKIEIGSKEYTVKLAESDEDHDKGLQGITELPENKGMLFIFSEPDEISFYMKDTHIPLDIIFINEDLEVISIYKGQPNNTDIAEEDNVKYVLELNINSGVSEGDDLEIEDEEDDKTGKMIVISSNGDSQMELEGGERIFSRKNTKVLIKQAKQANNSKSDSDYKRLGKSMFKYLKIQDANEPEFVELKDK